MLRKLVHAQHLHLPRTSCATLSLSLPPAAARPGQLVLLLTSSLETMDTLLAQGLKVTLIVVA